MRPTGSGWAGRRDRIGGTPVKYGDPRFRAIREKHGMAVLDDEEHLRALTAEGRVLLAITPDKPPSAWTCWGLD